MSHKWQDETTRHNAQESSDYAEITNVQPSFSGLSVSGSIPQHAIASPRTSKKRSFLASLSKGTQRKGATITRPMNQESMPEEPLEEVKEGDAERIRIMKMVKEGKLSVEEAMEQAKNLGIMTAAEPNNDENGEEKIFNFGVYKYGRDRTSLSRRILQFDFQEKVLCIIQRGNRNKKFAFTDVRGFDSEDGVRFYIYFDSDYELDADSVEEKNKICHLLDSIVQQNRGDQPDGSFEASSPDGAKIIKEGPIEKKGHSAAFMMWPRRWLRIQQGELSYFKMGEENQPALNIVKLGPGLAEVKSVDHNTFIIITNKKEYSFRVLNLNNAGDSTVERERDAWIEAIAAASQVNFRHSRASSVIPDETAIKSTVAEQEKFLKDVVRTLQRELEQLASVLSVVNAPIQATVQVKKVKDVVRNLDSQVKTGVLSWTMRQVLQSRKESLKEGNASMPQSRKESLKDSSAPAPQSTKTSPPRRKDSDRLPSLPPQRDDGYEAVQIPQWPSKPKPVPTTPTEQSEYSMPPPRPHKPSELSSTADSTPQQTVPPVRPTGRSGSAVNAYETVEIGPRKPQVQQSPQGSDRAFFEPFPSHKPPRPVKPGSFIGSEADDSSSIYQAPPAPVSITASRDDVYDNVHIKNTPLSMTDSQDEFGSLSSLGTFIGGTSDSGIIKDDISNSHEVKGDTSSTADIEATDGKLSDVNEIDSGGMGCKNIEAAMEERRQILKEKQTKEGVVLLSVQKLNDKRSDPIATHAAEEVEDIVHLEETRAISGSNPPPPPPLPPSGVPPPPPLMASSAGSALGRPCAVQSKLKLRPFFWNKVPAQMVSSSVWMNAADRTKSINLELLEEMFQVEEKEKVVNAAPTKPAAKTLLDPKRAQNLGIFLSGFKLSTKEIDEKLSVFREEDGALRMDHVIALKRFLPSTEESEMYKNYKEDPSTLVPEDQFMMKLCEINDLEKRLDLLLVIMEFPTQFEDLAPNVTNLLEACKELYNSKNFLLVLEYVLSVGNILNAGSNRGGAYGFKLQSLPKLVDIRGNNKKYTLLKFLILQLQQSNPEALNFTDELKSVPKAATCSSKALFAEVEVMKKDLLKIKKHSSDLFLKRNQTNPKDVKLHNDVEAFVSEYEEKLNELCDKCKQMKQIYNKVLASFGESQSSDSEELFGAISTFMNQFKKASKEHQHGSRHNKGVKLEGLREAIAQRQKSTDDTISIASMSSLSSTSTAFVQDNVDAGKSSRNEQPSVGNRDVILERKPSNKEQNKMSGGPLPVIHRQLSTKSPPPKPPVRAGPKPTKQGFLDKLSGGKHQTPKWDNRYFELTDTGYLYYYKKADGGKPINSIYLRGCPIEIDPGDPCVVVVKTDERDWSLKAVNAEEACVWKDVLSFYTDKQN